MDGNTGMMIWLGKQHLGQKDTSRQEITGKDGKDLSPILNVTLTK
jgi:hypothetical protein